MADRMGLVQAAQQLGSYGRGPDRQLAHISPNEAEFLDYMQGGRQTNPHTGLPEYSLFGKILKAVARVAATVGAFVISGGNPLAAAAANGAVTKLTGGSWKDSLKSAAITGVTAGIGNYATGPSLWSNSALSSAGSAGASGAAGIGAGSNAATGAGFGSVDTLGSTAASSAIPASAGMGGVDALGSTAATAGIPAAAPAATGIGAAVAPTAASETTKTGLQTALTDVGGYPGVATGLAGISVPINPATGMPSGPSGPPPGFGGNINLNVAPQVRQYQPYTGDYAHYGEPVANGGSGGWQFFDNVNPKPQFLAQGGRAGIGYAEGGRVSAEQQKRLNDARRLFRSIGDQSSDALHRLLVGPSPDGLEPNGSDAWTQKQGNYLQKKLMDEFGGLGAFIDSRGMLIAPTDERPQGFAIGGGVNGPQSPGNGLMGLGALRNPGIPSQIQSPTVPDQSYARSIGRNLSPVAQRDDIRRAAIMGYMNAKGGGRVSGPGTGESDSIPAMLSDGEHVVDKKTIDMLGGGSNERGQKAMEKMKQKIRQHAGVKNPRKPPAFQGAA